MQAFHLAGQFDHIDGQADPALPRDGIAGIEQQIEQHHLQLPGIHLDQGQVRLQHNLQVNRTRQRMLQ
ncbi:hypothetical protein D3C75_941530 [compost metagenome]